MSRGLLASIVAIVKIFHSFLRAEGSDKPQNCGKTKRKASQSNRTKKEAKQDSDLDSEAEHEHIIDVPSEPEAEPHGNDAAQDGHMSDDAQASRVEDATAESDRRGRIKKDNFLLVESKALNVDKILFDNSDFDFARSEEQRALVKEAFANDAVLEEFAKEKDKQENLRMPKDEDFTLPGWGEWAGANINNEKILNRKRKKFMKKGKKQPPSKDARLKYVIINERKNKKFTANQVVFGFMLCCFCLSLFPFISHIIFPFHYDYILLLFCFFHPFDFQIFLLFSFPDFVLFSFSLHPLELQFMVFLAS